MVPQKYTKIREEEMCIVTVVGGLRTCKLRERWGYGVIVSENMDMACKHGNTRVKF